MWTSNAIEKWVMATGRTIVENGVMARRKVLRSELYRAARDLGNVQATRGGPTSYGKRLVRRKVYRTTNG
jgi:hypothetical protein